MDIVCEKEFNFNTNKLRLQTKLSPVIIKSIFVKSKHCKHKKCTCYIKNTLSNIDATNNKINEINHAKLIKTLPRDILHHIVKFSFDYHIINEWNQQLLEIYLDNYGNNPIYGDNMGYYLGGVNPDIVNKPLFDDITMYVPIISSNIQNADKNVWNNMMLFDFDVKFKLEYNYDITNYKNDILLCIDMGDKIVEMN